MLKTTELLINHKLQQRVIRDSDLSYLFRGSAARRYGLVNKALKKGELIRLCRGFYMLAPKYQKQHLSRYYIANRIVPHSFITAESALSFHHLIPERVTQVTSISAFGRSREYNTPLGLFCYHVAPVHRKNFYLGVNLIEINEQFIYMASPLRALIDYIYWHKVQHANFDYLEHSLRIERDDLALISAAEAKALRSVYDVRYVKKFLSDVIEERLNG